MKAPTIDLLHHTPSIVGPTLSSLNDWIRAACKIAKPITPSDPAIPKTLTVVITHHDAMVELNHKFRQKDHATNVLSFPDEPLPGETPSSWGDVVFCHHTIEIESERLQIPIMHHYAHLTVHGWLHLLGYDHENERDASLMELLETSILQTLGIPNPY